MKFPAEKPIAMNYKIPEFPRAMEPTTRLPIKKRKLRANFALEGNDEPLQKKIPGFCQTHHTALHPFQAKHHSPVKSSTLEAIEKDINSIMCSVVDKSSRKILLLETKNRWRTKLGLSKIEFSNGLWLLARNKANATVQYEENNIHPISPMPAKSPRDRVNSPGLMMLADATNSILNSPISAATTPGIGSEDSSREIHRAKQQQLSWNYFFHTGIFSLGPSYWG